MANRQRAVVIFPGRGSYAGNELGYLTRHHADQMDLIKRLDEVRGQNGATPVLELDRMEKFSPSKHLPGRNASNLIYTCAQADFRAIDREKIDVVAICGNSLGWYLTLAAAGALSLDDGAHLVDTMGGLMEREGTGGQLLCPVSDEFWHIDNAARDSALQVIEETENAFLSIDLAGTLVLAGDTAALKVLQDRLKAPDGSSLIQLPKHAAFHTPLLNDVSKTARSILPSELFNTPETPIIDGCGRIWSPNSTDVDDLYNYTLHSQIVEPYDFAKSVEVALKEFAPDLLILTGPGGSLGAPVAQCLISHRWRQITDRESFMKQQSASPYLISMGREEQRHLAI
ncbi:[Acyl-carrier-protein] S-malonyltransferase [Altererythrobacter insulae]|nr:[Acyl-carrier-protein] S-malonyltransferase [Altererythrobacter insulae]